jgi:hypothetical protein
MKHPSCPDRRICQEFANGRALTIGQFRTQQRTERWGEVHYGDSPVQFARPQVSTYRDKQSLRTVIASADITVNAFDNAYFFGLNSYETARRIAAS